MMFSPPLASRAPAYPLLILRPTRFSPIFRSRDGGGPDAQTTLVRRIFVFCLAVYHIFFIEIWAHSNRNIHISANGHSARTRRARSAAQCMCPLSSGVTRSAQGSARRVRGPGVRVPPGKKRLLIRAYLSNAHGRARAHASHPTFNQHARGPRTHLNAHARSIAERARAHCMSARSSVACGTTRTHVRAHECAVCGEGRGRQRPTGYQSD